MTLTISNGAPAVRDDAPEWLPRRLGGGYAVARMLGETALGPLVLARGTVSGRLVVVKVLPEYVAGDRMRLDRFLGAAERACRLFHPNVVRVFGAGVDRRPFVVMDYVRGETLGRRLERDGRFPADETLRLGIHLAAGLAHAHANGVVHGAVGADSILLGCDGVARFVDFGLDPVVAGRPAGGPTGDVYGLGLVLRQVGGSDMAPGLLAAVDAMLAPACSGRPSAVDVFHQLITISSPPGVWLAPA